MDEIMNISRLAYEMYKQDWIETHTTSKERLQARVDYFDHCRDLEEDGCEVPTFEEYLEEFGFPGGSLYVCYDEFLNTEYRKPDYICALLRRCDGLQDYAVEGLIDAYRKDLDEREEAMSESPDITDDPPCETEEENPEENEGKEYNITVERTYRRAVTFRAADDKEAEEEAKKIYGHFCKEVFPDGDDSDYALVCTTDNRTVLDWSD